MTTLIIGTFVRISTVLAINSFLAAIVRSVGVGVATCLRRLFAGLHESRQQQAEQIVERYRHLIADADIKTVIDKRLSIQNESLSGAANNVDLNENAITHISIPKIFSRK